jgi:hypothetical protein
MQHLFLVYTNEQLLSMEEQQSRRAGISQLAHELHSTGRHVSRMMLHPASVAMCVRVRDGNRFVTNGPFADTREQLDGIFLVDVDDLDVALSIAARMPMGKMGTVEIRQLIPETDHPR